ncbi:MAG: FtsX-like permease family protein [Candidatus Thorarchaeota archaeon]|nr:MAG: FtsX-like permease family protein [Candidatus Thorarchaeota archaeon]
MRLELARMGFRNAFRRKQIAAFTVLSIAISVSLLYTALSASTSLQRSANMFLQDTLSPVDITVTATKWGVPITEQHASSIRVLPGVTNLVPRIEEYGFVRNGSVEVYLAIVGLNLTQESHIGGFDLTDGDMDLAGSGCFVTEQARALLNLSLGDELGINLAPGLHFFNVTGFGLVTDKGILGPVVFISMERAWEIYHIRYPDHSFNKLMVEVLDLFEIPILKHRIESIVGADFRVSNLKAYHLEIAQSFISQARLILFTLVVIACFIAVFRVFSSYANVFGERRYETGVMLAFGTARRSMLIQLLSEVGTIGLMGCIFGLGAGIAIGLIVLRFLVLVSQIAAVAPTTQFFQATTVLDPMSLLVAGTVGFSLAILAGLLPAWRAINEPVIKSLGAGSIPKTEQSGAVSEKTRRLLHLGISAFAVLTCSVVIIQILSDLFRLYIVQDDNIRVLSIPAFILAVIALSPKLQGSIRLLDSISTRASQSSRWLSRKNLRRNTLSSFLVFNLFSAATVMFLASTNVGYVITESWKQNVGGQTTSANVVAYMEEPAPINLLEQVTALSHVTSVVPINQDLTDLRHSTQNFPGLVFGVQPEGFDQLASLAILESVNKSRGLEIVEDTMSAVVSDYGAQVLDVEIGSEIYIGDGSSVTVVGICSSAVPVFVVAVFHPTFVIVSTDTWAAIAGEPFAIGSLLIESSSPNETVEELSDIPGVHPVLVSQLEADYQSALQSVQLIADSSLIALFVATLVSALLSSLAITSTRRREIGLMAAFGMKDTDIAWTLASENAVAMTSGVITGVVAGLIVEIALSDIIVRYGGALLALIDIRTAFLVVFSLLTSLVMAYYTIRRSTQTEVIRLLRDLSRRD